MCYLKDFYFLLSVINEMNQKDKINKKDQTYFSPDRSVDPEFKDCVISLPETNIKVLCKLYKKSLIYLI